MATNYSTDKPRALDANHEAFVSLILPKYTGPQVYITLNPSGYTCSLSKNLICSYSEYFQAMFEGDFKEKASQVTTMEEVDGVVSMQSLELLIQWFYLGRVIFKATKDENKISSIIEFSRFADMCGVAGMEFLMAKEIRAIIRDKENMAASGPLFRNPGSNTRWITGKHIKSAFFLPKKHPIRQVMAETAVEEYFRSKDDHKFYNEIREVPEFAVDFLVAIKSVLKTLKKDTIFSEPITGHQLYFRSA